MSFDTQITVIGAGVVGLAIAAELSQKYDDLFVIERHHDFGQETSSRNSEVIHSGIYYPNNSLKALHCVQGRRMLYDFCLKYDVPHNQCGKLIVATDQSEIPLLDGIMKQAKSNGVEQLKLLSKSELTKLEPNITAESALHFPLTGIIDSHSLMKRLSTIAHVNGSQFVYKSEVIAITKLNEGYNVRLKDKDNQDFEFSTKVVINASGLQADKVSELVGINEPSYRLYYWKGEYFAVGNGKNKLVNRLIYPIPNKNITGLGIHSTIDMNGGLKLGPNSIYLEDKSIDYKVDSEHRSKFFDAAKRFLPFLEEEDLHPDQSGVRPKLQQPGDSVRDFIITNETDKGFHNFINLIGIESPGLTSCLSIAKSVKNLISI